MDNTGKKVVIFDDDEDILSISSFVLREQGWEVYTFTDCNDIVQKVSEIGPDVILMDNWIPGEGGILAAKALKNSPECHQIPIIYFSATNEIQSLAEQAGVDGYLAKPFDLEELEQVLNRMVNK